MTGHCEHCGECEVGLYLDRHSTRGDNGPTWPDGDCPYCAGAKAERERIAAAIAAAAPREDPLHRDAIREAAEDAYLTCWTIARGGQ